MSGYVASAQIVHGAPRLARVDPAAERSVDARPATASAALIVESVVPAAGPIDRLAERVAAVRERWSQLTSFLFDPDSWR